MTTSWNDYYEHPFPLARFTRAYSAHRLTTLLRTFVSGSQPLRIAELGAGKSVFLRPLSTDLVVKQYLALDNRTSGLRSLPDDAPPATTVMRLCADVLQWTPSAGADVCFSVGLVEHFKPADTVAAIAAHYRCVRPGGIVAISAPTPTWLYRSARFAAECSGQWRFHDERPIAPEEIGGEMRKFGPLLHVEILWPLVFTQVLLIAQKTVSSY